MSKRRLKVLRVKSTLLGDEELELYRLLETPSGPIRVSELEKDTEKSYSLLDSRQT